MNFFKYELKEIKEDLTKLHEKVEKVELIWKVYTQIILSFYYTKMYILK